MLRVQRFVSAFGVAAGFVVASACTNSAVESDDLCDDLAARSLIDLFIDSAEWTASDGATPAHCKVIGAIETEINFELLLPDSSSWNGRFLMGGGGGYVGTVQNQAIGLFDEGGTPLQRGYATVGTDTGHQGSGIEAEWALDHRTRQRNWGHRAVHVTAEAAKSIIQQYYGRLPTYSYFVGCSRGGGQAMMESQRYPTDFDGIVAAAPAYNWTAFTAGFVQIQQAMFPDGDLNRPVLTPESLSLLGTSILAACDADDGVVDGVMTDPRRCDFSPAELPRCAGGKPAADCLTEAQLTAIEAVYDGPISNDKPFFFGFNYGGENDQGGWDSWVVKSSRQWEREVPNAQYGFGTEFYKYFVFGDPNWDYKNYDFSTWREDTAEISRVVDATETDLTEFRDRGGKIIYWTGWSDLALTPLGTIDYYERLKMDDPSARDYARLYMLPGVLHCASGPGPDKVDWVEVIQAWVEEGRAPERLVALKRDATGSVTLTRPVCPYPQKAVYDGVGDPSLDSSFTCARP